MIPPSGPRTRVGVGDGVNVAALRDITDDSGGRTEVIRSPRDLEPATAYIADELSKQYYLGYAASGSKDGRWHSIRVEVDRAYTSAHARDSSRHRDSQLMMRLPIACDITACSLTRRPSG